MIFNGFPGELRVSLTQELIVNSNAVVSQGLTMTVVDTFANIEKLEIIIDCLLVLLDVVIENPDGVV